MDKMSWFKLPDGTFIRMKNNKPMTKLGEELWDKQESRKF